MIAAEDLSLFSFADDPPTALKLLQRGIAPDARTRTEEDAGFRAFADTARRRGLTVKSGIADEYIDSYNCHNHSNRVNYHDPRSPSDDGAPESGRVAQ